MDEPDYFKDKSYRQEASPEKIHVVVIVVSYYFYIWLNISIKCTDNRRVE